MRRRRWEALVDLSSRRVPLFAGTGTFRYIFRYFFRYFLGTFSGTFSGTFQVLFQVLFKVHILGLNSDSEACPE